MVTKVAVNETTGGCDFRCVCMLGGLCGAGGGGLCSGW